MKLATYPGKFAPTGLWKRLVNGAIVGVLMTVMLAGCNQDRALAVRDMNIGLEAYESGKSMDAVRYLKEAAKNDPTYPEPLYYLGQIYHLRLKEYDNAELYYRKALEISAENPQFAYRLGAVLAEQGKHADAVQVLRRSVNAKDDYARAWFRLGLSQQEMANYSDAVDSYMKSIQIDPRLRMDRDDRGGEHYHALGDLYVRFGLYDNALKVYENAIQNNANVARLYHGRGVAQLHLKRYSEAAASFEKTLELDASHPTGVFNLAVARQALGQDVAAIEVLQRFLDSGARGGGDPARIIAAQGLLQQLREKQRSE